MLFTVWSLFSITVLFTATASNQDDSHCSSPLTSSLIWRFLSDSLLYSIIIATTGSLRGIRNESECEKPQQFLWNSVPTEGVHAAGKYVEMSIFTFLIKMWSPLQIQTGVSHGCGRVLLSPERQIFENTEPKNAALIEKKKEREKQRSLVNAVIFYLKADLVVTSDDGFKWSFWGRGRLTGSFPLLNY